MFFFFKQKTAYEMRISDWSSDVCSSDLPKHSAWSATNYAARIFTTPVAWAWQTPWRPWKPALPDSTPAWPDWADAHTRQAPAATSQPKICFSCLKAWGSTQDAIFKPCWRCVRGLHNGFRAKLCVAPYGRERKSVG